jgi:hypothetical protein
VLLLYVTAALVFFAKVVFSNRNHFPWDFVDFHYPAHIFLSTSLRDGVYPLWNPDLMLGYPIMGDLNVAPFYPLSIVFWFLPGAFPLPLRLLELGLIGHIVIAGMSVFWLCRFLGTRYPSAVIAGLIFMFAGFFPARVQHEGWVRTAAWLPLTLLLFMRAMQAGRSYGAAVGAGAVFGLSILAGHWQTCLYTGYVLAFWLLWQWLVVEGIHNYNFAKRAIVQGCICVLASISLSAIQVIPAVEMFTQTARGQLGFRDSAVGAVGVRNLITLFLPTLTGEPRLQLSQDISLSHFYCGTIALAIFFIGCSAAGIGRLRTRGFLIALVVAATALSVGSSLPFYGFAYKYLPGFDLFRRPYAFLLYAMLGFAVLSAYGMDAVTELTGRHRTQIERTRNWFGVVFAVYAVLLVAILAASSVLRTAAPGKEVTADITLVLSRLAASFGTMIPLLLVTIVFLHICGKPSRLARYVSTLMIVCVFVDLAWFNSNRIFNTAPGDPRSVFGGGHILGASLPARLLELGAAPTEGRVAIARYGGVFDNAANAFGFQSFGGYNPLKLKRYSEFVALVDSPNSNLLSLANVRYILTSPPYLNKTPDRQMGSALASRIALPSGPLDPVRYRLSDASQNRWFLLYENTSALPRVFVASGYIVVADPAERLAYMRRAAVDLTRRAILEEEPRVPIGDCSDGQVSLVHYSANSLVAKARLNAPCLVVVSDAWYPGWRAYVSGMPTRILRANHTFRAVPAPAGEHTIEMRFEPWSFRIGAAISTATILGMVFLVARSKVRRSGG